MSTQFTTDPIEILDEWNAVLTQNNCCCAMPECPVPTMECQSITSFAKAYGVLNEEDNKLYQRQRWYFAPVGSTSNSDVYNEWDGFGWGSIYDSEPPGPEYEDMRIEWSGDAHLLDYYAPYIARHVYGRNTCFQESELAFSECAGTQTQTWTEWTGFTNTGEAFYSPVTYSGVSTYTEVGGEETDEHAAWIALWGTEAAWQAAYDQWVIDHAAWVIDYAAWEIAWAEWDSGGQIGPEPVAPVEPVEPAGEPTEFYPPCTVRRMLREELTAYEYDGGFRQVPSTEEEPNPTVINSGPEYFQSFIGGGGDKEYESVINFSEILAAARDSMTGVDWDACAVIDPLFAECSSTMASTPEQNTDVIEITLVKARFRWVIPQDWSPGMAVPGSYFKITWDIATYPTDPEAEISYIQDLTWEWTGPGDPEDEDSWKSGWYEIDPPGEPGERKIVNIRYECYRSPQFGNKPQITGDAEDISDDVPLQRRFTSDRHSINLLLT